LRAVRASGFPLPRAPGNTASPRQPSYANAYGGEAGPLEIETGIGIEIDTHTAPSQGNDSPRGSPHTVVPSRIRNFEKLLRRGVEGNIITGEELPIQEQTTTSGSVTTSTKYKSVGIKLKVCPLMISGDTIRLSVRPEVSNVSRYSTEGNPVIAIRSADTELEIKDGELISIGGLLRTEEKINKTRVPIAGALPVIGHLFRSARRENIKSQLVIFLTIDILQEGTADGVNVTRPDDIPPFVTKEIKELNERETKARRPRAQLLEDFDTLTRDGRD